MQLLIFTPRGTQPIAGVVADAETLGDLLVELIEGNGPIRVELDKEDDGDDE